MSRYGIRGGAVVKCDASCSETFLTYSMISIARIQATGVGWGRVPAWQITSEAPPRRKLDVCPRHKEEAASNKVKRDQVNAEKRAAKMEAKRKSLAGGVM